MTFFKTFFEEKDLAFASWELTAPDGTVHLINNEVVIEAIHGTTGQERKAIERTIRRLDFLNADVNDFLKHLAQGLVNNFPARA